MSDERKDEFSSLERRLAELPRELAPEANAWSAIERAIEDAPLDARLRTLAQSVEPAEDLWPRIEHDIRDGQAPTRSSRPHRYAATALLAASLAAVAIGGFFLRGYFVPADSSSATQAPELHAGGDDEFARGNDTDPAEDLIFSRNPRPGLGEAQAVYAAHIALVREQRKAIEASLVEYPNDLSLRALWRHAYETELFLIDEAGRTLSTI